MCLLLQRQPNEKGKIEADVSNFDIVCYKVLLKVEHVKPFPFKRNKLGKRAQYDYHSPYYMDYVYGKTNTEKRFERHIYGNFVNYGLHTFVSMDDAFRELGDWDIICDALLDPKPCVVKCVIPAGTYYYKGHTYDDKESYCSENLSLKEEIICKPL
jgi:hypothetical protein